MFWRISQNKHIKKWIKIITYLINSISWFFSIFFWFLSSTWSLLIWSSWILLAIIITVAIWMIVTWFFFVLLSALYIVQFIPIFSIKATVDDYWIRKYEYTSEMKTNWNVFSWEYDKDSKKFLQLANFVTWWLFDWLTKPELKLKERVERCRKLASLDWEQDTLDWKLDPNDKSDKEFEKEYKNKKFEWRELINNYDFCTARVEDLVKNEVLKKNLTTFINGIDNVKSIRQSSMNIFSIYQLQWIWIWYIKDYSDFCYNVWTIKDQLTKDNTDFIDQETIDKLNNFFNKTHVFWQRILNPHWDQINKLSKEENDFWIMMYLVSVLTDSIAKEKWIWFKDWSFWYWMKDENVFSKFIVDMINERDFFDEVRESSDHHFKNNWKRKWNDKWNHRTWAYWIFVNQLWDSQYFSDLELNYTHSKQQYNIPLNSFETKQAWSSRTRLLNFYKRNCEWWRQINFIKNNLYSSNSFLFTKVWQKWFEDKIFNDFSNKKEFNEIKPYHTEKLINYISLNWWLESNDFSENTTSNDSIYRNLLKNYIYFNNVSLNNNESIYSVLWDKEIKNTKLNKLYHQLWIVWWTSTTKSLINKLNQIEILKWYLSWRYSVLDFWLTSNIYKSDQYYKYITLMNPFPSYNSKITIKDSDIKWWWFFDLINWTVINWNKIDLVENIPFVEINLTDYAKSKWYDWNKEIYVKYFLYWIWKNKENTLFWKTPDLNWKTKIWDINPYTFKFHWIDWTETNLLVWAIYEQMKKDVEKYMQDLDLLFNQWFSLDWVKWKQYISEPKKVEICRSAPIIVDSSTTVINRNYYQLLSNEDFNWWFPLVIPSKKYYQVCLEVDNVLVNWSIYEKVYQWNQQFWKKFFEIWRTNLAFVSIKLKDYIPQKLNDWTKQDIYFSNNLALLEKYKTKSIMFNDWNFCTLEPKVSLKSQIKRSANFWSPFWNIWDNKYINWINWVSVMTFNKWKIWIKNTEFNFTHKDWIILEQQDELYSDWNKKRRPYFNTLSKYYWQKNWSLMNYINWIWSNIHFDNLYTNFEDKTELNNLDIVCKFNSWKEITLPKQYWVSDYLLDQNVNSIALNYKCLKNDWWCYKKEAIYKFNWYKNVDDINKIWYLTDDILHYYLHDLRLNDFQKKLKDYSILNSLSTISQNKYDYYFEYLKKLLWKQDTWLDWIWNILFREWNKYYLKLQEENNTLLYEEEISENMKNWFYKSLLNERDKFFKQVEKPEYSKYNEYIQKYKNELLKTYDWFEKEIWNIYSKIINNIKREDILWTDNRIDNLLNIYNDTKKSYIWTWKLDEKIDFNTKLPIEILWKISKSDQTVNWLYSLSDLSPNYETLNKWYKFSSLFDFWYKSIDWKSNTPEKLRKKYKNIDVNKLTWLDTLNYFWLNYYTLEDYENFWWSLHSILSRKTSISWISKDIEAYITKKCEDKELLEYLEKINWIYDYRIFWSIFWDKWKQVEYCKHKLSSNISLWLLWLSNSLHEKNMIWKMNFDLAISKNKINQIWYQLLQEKIKSSYFDKYNQALFVDFDNYRYNFWKSDKQYKSINDQIKEWIEKQSKEQYEEAKTNYEKMNSWLTSTIDNHLKNLEQNIEKLKKAIWIEKKDENKNNDEKIEEVSKENEKQEEKQEENKNILEQWIEKIKEAWKKTIEELEKEKKKLEDEKKQINSTNEFNKVDLNWWTLSNTSENEYQLKEWLVKFVPLRIEEELELLWYYTYMNPIVTFFKKPPKEFSKEVKNNNLTMIEKTYKELWEIEKIFNSYIIYSNIWQPQKDSTDNLPLFQYEKDQNILKWLRKYFSESWYLRNNLNDTHDLKFTDSVKKQNEILNIHTDLTKIWTWYYHSLFEILNLRDEKKNCEKSQYLWADSKWLLAALKQNNEKFDQDLCKNTSFWSKEQTNILHNQYLENSKWKINFDYLEKVISNWFVQKLFERQEWSNVNKTSFNKINQEINTYFKSYESQFQIFDEIINDLRTKRSTLNNLNSLKILSNIIYLWQNTTPYIFNNYLMWLLETWNEWLFNLWIKNISKIRWFDHVNLILNETKDNIWYEYFKSDDFKKVLFWISDYEDNSYTDKIWLIRNHFKNIEKNIINTNILLYWMYRTNIWKSSNNNMFEKLNLHNVDKFITKEEKEILIRNKIFWISKSMKDETWIVKNTISEQLLKNYLEIWNLEKKIKWNTNEIKDWSNYFKYLVLLKWILSYQYSELEQWKENNNLNNIISDIWIIDSTNKNKISYLLYYIDWLISTYYTDMYYYNWVVDTKLFWLKWNWIDPQLLSDYYDLFSNEQQIYKMILYMYWFDRYHDETWKITYYEIDDQWKIQINFENNKYVRKNKVQWWSNINLNLLSNDTFEKNKTEYWIDWIIKNSISNVTLSILWQLTKDNKDIWLYFVDILNSFFNEEENLIYEHVFNVTWTWMKYTDKEWLETINEAKTYILKKYTNNYKFQSLKLQDSIRKDMKLFAEYLSTNKFLNNLLTNEKYSSIRNKININETSIDTIVNSYLVSEQLNVKNFWLLNEILSRDKYKKHSIFLNWLQWLNEEDKLNIIAFNYFSYELNKNRLKEIENAANALKYWWTDVNVQEAEWEWFIKWLDYIKCKSWSNCEKIITNVKWLKDFFEFHKYIWTLKDEAKWIKDERLRDLTIDIIDKLTWLSMEYHSWYQYFYVWEKFPNQCKSYEECWRYRPWWSSESVRNWQCVWWSNIMINENTWIWCRYSWNANQQEASLWWKWWSVYCQWEWEYMWLPWWWKNKIYFTKMDWKKWNLIAWRNAWKYWHIFYIAAYDSDRDSYLTIETNWRWWQYCWWWEWKCIVKKDLRFKMWKRWTKWRSAWKQYIQWMFDLDQPFSNRSK